MRSSCVARSRRCGRTSNPHPLSSSAALATAPDDTERRVRLDLRARFRLSIELRARGVRAGAVAARVHGCAASDGAADSRWFGSSKSACKYAGSLGASDERCRATVHSLSKIRPRIRRTSERITRRNPLDERALDEAADGTRTHDLLHGKQYVKARFPACMRASRPIRCDRIASDYRGFWYRRGTGDRVR
jgi:hypothetical protein